MARWLARRCKVRFAGVGTPCSRPKSTISPFKKSASIFPVPRTRLCQDDPATRSWPATLPCFIKAPLRAFSSSELAQSIPARAKQASASDRNWFRIFFVSSPGGEVADNALLLEVIAGRDGYDPRSDHVKTHQYTTTLGAPIKEMRIGLVKEGFGHDVSEPDVDEKVRCAADVFRDLGVVVEEISIPWHLMGVDIWLPITIEAQTQNFISGGSYGYGHSNLYVGSFIDLIREWPARANELPPTSRFLHFLGSYIHNQYGNRYYGKAMNINRQLIAAYDDALSRHDLLMMPTTPNKAQPLPGPDVSVEEYVQSAMGMIPNTAPFNSTHHPAMAVPCGMSDGLPVSLMLIGKHFDESSIYRVASAFEQATDWETM